MNLQQSGKEHLITSISLHGNVRNYDTQTNEVFWLRKYLLHFQKLMNKPWIIINGDTNLLDRLHLNREQLKAIKGKEVSFFFYEPLFPRSNESARCPAFIHPHTAPRFPELEWLQNFLHNHGNTFKAKVHVCDYRLKEYLSHKRQHINLPVHTWDIFLADTCRSLVEKEIDRDPQFAAKDYPFQSKIQKKFICPNFRYEGFRELVVGYLAGSNQLDQGHISFFHQHQRPHFLDDLPFDPKKLNQWQQIFNGLEKLQQQLPLTMDTHLNKSLLPQEAVLPDFDGVSNQRSDYRFHKWYDESFLAIVNETRFGTLCGEISEKTLIPILYMRPFVVVGGPFMLKYLHEMGFETFADCWDESYDQIEDHGARMQAILNLLDDLLSKPLEEMQELLTKLKPRLERNRRHLLFRLQEQMHETLLKDS
jgi:hypothetical protein